MEMDGLTQLERRAKAILESGGYRVLRSGWPDFLAVYPAFGKPSLAFGVEVKSDTDELNPAQQTMVETLTAIGLPTYVMRSNDLPGIGNRRGDRVVLPYTVALVEKYIEDIQGKIYHAEGWVREWGIESRRMREWIDQSHQPFIPAPAPAPLSQPPGVDPAPSTPR